MIIVDTSAVMALAAGHKALNALAVNITASGDRLLVPALCLAQAEASQAGAARAVLGYPCADVEALAQIDAPAVGTMVRDGYGALDTCHALYSALRRTGTGGMPILLTDDEDRYPPGILAIGIDTPGMLGFH
ncbi:hypothetical protein A8W25_24885 [Streptomyces sp. ERV7]|uniref:hypothetical protein n=1 Tax=Streptomyces sp. ERV7 TaxID=1322334 RepID=UPI0007F3929C|nr:hypothetical protein [Streptomyces sp. ERV7]OAR22811.1 hypothetical protein A8W25_24885 [Streptomyces sp. ERV7]